MFDETLVTESRLTSAKKKELTPLRFYPDDKNAFFGGSSGEMYFTTLDECQCVDFSINGRVQPCKHMIRLAMECGLMDCSGMQSDPEGAKARYCINHAKDYIRETPVAQMVLFLRPICEMLAGGSYYGGPHRLDEAFDINGIENCPLFVARKNGDFDIQKKYRKDLEGLLVVVRNRLGELALERIFDDDLVEMLGRKTDND